MVLTFALIVELVQGVAFVSLMYVAAIQQYRLYKKYPFQGLRFFFWGLFLSTAAVVTVVFIVVLRVLDLADMLRDFLIQLYKVTFAIGVVGIAIFALGLVAIQPRPRERSWSFTQMVIGGIVGFTIAAIFMTLTYSWIEEKDFRQGDIFIDYDILVSIGMVLLVVLLSLIALRHINNLREIQKLDPKPTQFLTRWLPLAYISLILTVFLLFLYRIPGLEEFQLALTFIIPAAVAGFGFTMAFRKYPSLLAITSAKLSSLIFVNPDGLTYFAYDFKSKESSFDNLTVLLGGMLAALNISLSETLESREGLSSIAFGDKLIVIHSTEKFVLYLITSEMNPVISDLVKIFESRFEGQFGALIGRSTVIDQNEFLSFTDTVEDLIQFAPLSD